MSKSTFFLSKPPTPHSHYYMLNVPFLYSKTPDNWRSCQNSLSLSLTLKQLSLVVIQKMRNSLCYLVKDFGLKIKFQISNKIWELHFRFLHNVDTLISYQYQSLGQLWHNWRQLVVVLLLEAVISIWCNWWVEVF